MITKNLSTLQIHKLSKNQYDREYQAGNLSTDILYLTPEEDILPIVDGGTGASDIETARANLGVYSKAEIDALIGNIGALLDAI